MSWSAPQSSSWWLFAGEQGIFKLIGVNLLPALFGNIIGGASLFAILAWGQVHEEMEEQD